MFIKIWDEKIFFLISIFCSSVLTKTFGQNYADVQGTWYGTATLVERLKGEYVTSERNIELTIIKNKVTGMVKYSGDVRVGPAVGHDECFGTGPGELISVNIRAWEGTYDINIEGPDTKPVDGQSTITGMVVRGSGTGVQDSLKEGRERFNAFSLKKRMARWCLSEQEIRDLLFPGQLRAIQLLLKE